MLEQTKAALPLEPAVVAAIPSSFDMGPVHALDDTVVSGFGSVGCRPPVLDGYTDPAPIYRAGVAIPENRPIFGAGHNEAAPLRYSVEPALPAGLALDPAAGAISGTPAAGDADLTDQRHTVTVGNAGGQSSCDVSLTLSQWSPRFTSVGPGVTVSEGGRRCAQTTSAGHRFAVATPQLPQGVTLWRIKIHTIHNSHWMLAGIIGTTAPAANSYNGSTCYGWAGSGQVYIAGANTFSHDGWPPDHPWQANDEVILRFDSGSRRLSMAHSRLRRAFSVNVGPATHDRPWYVHLNLHGQRDSAEVSPATQGEYDAMIR